MSYQFIRQQQISDRFWSSLRETCRTEGLAYQWKALNDEVPGAEPSYCIRNFLAAAGKVDAKHGGFVFQDSDVSKWLEAVAFSLTWHPDAELEALADSAIDIIVDAQQPDGYLDTYYIINGLEKRWTNLMDHHEMYCAGHMLEAAVAYYRATGKDKLLKAMIRLMDHIDARFGTEEGKLRGYPGHPVLEMALMKLYELTNEERYLKLATYFITERGQAPIYFREEIKNNNLDCYWDHGHLDMAYYQAHQPLTEQNEAVGHAVRALYLYAGLCDVARVTDNKDLLAATHRLWKSVTEKRMYITGGVGSSAYGESFTFDYDLPNDSAYTESCASIALVFLAQRMLRLETRSEYADVMERALYNGIISGMQLDGKRFFYVNPLEVFPEACELDEHKRHVKPVRQQWFGCACCPPNIIRMLMSLQDYIWSGDDTSLQCHLYVQGCTETKLSGVPVALDMQTNYPWDGDIRLTVTPQTPVQGSISLRIPGWCRHYTCTVNGEAAQGTVVNGYLQLNRTWTAGDTVQLCLQMEPTWYRANSKVREDIGKLALMRGPIVYCLEQADNGDNLHMLSLGGKTPVPQVRFEEDLLGGVVTLACEGVREQESTAALYAVDDTVKTEPVTLRFIPYYAWTNREPGEMSVWVRR